ncbi:aminotransferase class I/II-fold pyridoxal phosphate-dependent enzyme [Cytobacillus oceanisediminis]|uniref:Aminotransferase class I/II-fold pyridoxal phosphate-dependent enzyme n=1 Tax=Niallia alba TaxID=2729105 RepID=A0A7Y0PLN3_9BACI|nr:MULTISPECIES: aminotransferase class I/II-fold pyridoxal phosphate-dependent enzyme [Bacillaceae]MBQ6448090.1 aminotransferase class I/II-fold pyridoxal phosphate-dependent enzyme [Bacillus sp. (in: firmicutes)]MBZ9535970.1 aminotransferase class I/II-fold pyridoxal phosphate-dependent enzyme [Cytobacillus oceanisediminis]NMO76895.1 aminotransferase class I/II-fold pyridoxal phosphate-dependent enzyme [Niallia alba]UTI40098.1 aminotransferase class I/II-fold pyridoxal phosphate-dependent enz
MYSFNNDYSEGAHPRILQALVESNLQQEIGYGQDSFTNKAAEVLKAKMNSDEVDVHLLVGGTQTNLIAISAFLRPHEAAIAASTGHIFVHETGAIEATGHKVITVDAKHGKLTPSLVQSVLDEHTDEHMVKPKLVYISNSTEIGTIYSKSELEQLSQFCQINNLIFYMDGARLGSALCAKDNDLVLSDFPKLLDAFYIGGTKNGALMGEALVIKNDSLKADFRYHIKQKGAMLAKGRLLGIQFYELFKDDLFFELAEYANKMAERLNRALAEKGYRFLTPSSTNQVFPIFSNEKITMLQKNYQFNIWEKIDKDHSAIRLVTSWATKEAEVEAFIKEI